VRGIISTYSKFIKFVMNDAEMKSGLSRSSTKTTSGKGSQTDLSTELSQPDSTPNSPQDTREINGPKGLEPTRYGDWESKGRCYDFWRYL